MAEPIIAVENLSAGYGDTVVLRDISFTVAPGEVFVILGGSGCGKSTLLKNMIGLYRPFSGRVLIGGRNFTASHGRERLDIIRSFGVMYQMGALFGSMSLLENVRLPMEELTDLPMEAMNMMARIKLGLVGLADFPNHMPAELSGGMQKRAAIARAMALDPAIIFLDEPSAGLDPVTSAELDDLILSLSRDLGMTFVVVSHELASIFTIANRVLMLDKTAGTSVAMGDPRELKESTDPVVSNFFNRRVAAKAAQGGT